MLTINNETLYYTLCKCEKLLPRLTFCGVDGFQRKRQIDVFCGNLSMDVTPIKVIIKLGVQALEHIEINMINILTILITL